MFDVLSILGNVFGAAAGTFELIGGGWGWLQLIVDAITGIAEGIMSLIG